jgi:hypothetical protein
MFIYVGAKVAQSVWGLGYGLDGRGSILASAGNVRTGSGAHPGSYPLGTEGFFPGSKAVGA